MYSYFITLCFNVFLVYLHLLRGSPLCSREPDLYAVIMRLHSCISMTFPLSSVSVRPLNCFLEAGDFGQGDKGNGMKHSLAVYLSFSARHRESAQCGTFTETEERAGCTHPSGQ